jgi:hypothetical protein
VHGDPLLRGNKSNKYFCCSCQALLALYDLGEYQIKASVEELSVIPPRAVLILIVIKRLSKDRHSPILHYLNCSAG